MSNRVSEVIVTPAGQSRSYVMHNREGQQPFSTTQMGSGGLSVPMFFRFEFGKSPAARHEPSSSARTVAVALTAGGRTPWPSSPRCRVQRLQRS